MIIAAASRRKLTRVYRRNYMCISRHVAHGLKRPACGTLRVNSCEIEEDREGKRERKRRSAASAGMRAFKPASVPSSRSSVIILSLYIVIIQEIAL